jgi:hypothetical protein
LVRSSLRDFRIREREWVARGDAIAEFLDASAMVQTLLHYGRPSARESEGRFLDPKQTGS